MKKFSRLSKLAAPMAAALVCVALPATAAWHAHAPAHVSKAHAMLPPTMSEQAPMVINIAPGRMTAQIVVPADKSRIIHFDQSFSRVHVGSGEIAEVVPLSSSTIYLLGKKRGSTNLTITNANNSIVAVVDVVVTYDVDGLRQHLAELLPTESIEIQPAGDALVLSGHVTSADHLRTIMAIADRYAPSAVTNLMSLSGSQQVLLEVKFAEVQRSALLNMGLNSLNGGVSNHGIGTPAVPTGATANSFATIGGLLTDSKTYFLSGQINALEQSGMVRTLAEPNVVALSGETASFLAGGELPIPVVQTSSGSGPTTTIQYKDFGVGLAFTPTVISDDTVNLVLKSEVSAIDPSVSVTTEGISVPGFKVRRSTTTVELRNGQSFAIAGLIQNDFNDSLNAIPGIGSIPILGALLRSTNYQRNQTELVVFITVHLVGPGPASNIALPTDRIIAPTPGQLLGLGHTEENVPSIPIPPPGSMNGTPPPVADAAPAPMTNVAALPPAPEAAPVPAPVVAVTQAPPAPEAALAPVVAATQAPPVVVAPPPVASAAPAAQPVVAVVAPPPVVSAAPAAPPVASVTPPPVVEVAPPPVVPEAPAHSKAAEAAPTPPAAEALPPTAEVASASPPSAPIAPTPDASEPVAPATKVAALPPAPAPDATSVPVPSATVTPIIPVPAAAKPVAVKPTAKKLRVAVAKPAKATAHLAAAKPAPKPLAADDLPVTAPANVLAADDSAASQPDSNGSTVP